MLKSLAKFTVASQLRSLVALCGNRQQRRFLNIHENTAYKLLRSVGIPTPEFGVALTPDEAAEIATRLDCRDLVVKAQVLSGGRGKGKFIDSNVGGVVTCESPKEVRELACMMLGKRLVTKQTGPDGWICNSVMVTTRMFTRKELYLSVMMERSFNGPVIISSSHGGVNIEEIAAENPEAITYTPVNPLEGLTCEQADEIVSSLGVSDVDVTSEIVHNLYELFLKTDALLLEINPLVQDIHGDYYALDCKCKFDDDAKFRQEELFLLKDNTVLSPAEVKAEKMRLSYIPLDGNIACMVNGAGLAMATMDIIKLYGGEPANFLDVGGNATASAIEEAVKIISADPKVESILVNIFGGILRCDIVAKGIVAAFKCFEHHVPTVVRLQGTNFDEGKKIILDSKLNIIPINDLAMAAEASVIMAYISQQTKRLNLDIRITPSEGKF